MTKQAACLELCAGYPAQYLVVRNRHLMSTRQEVPRKNIQAVSRIAHLGDEYTGILWFTQGPQDPSTTGTMGAAAVCSACAGLDLEVRGPAAQCQRLKKR